MSIKAVIWDLGGVIVRTEDHTPRKQLAEELDISIEKLYHLVFSGPMGTQAQLGEIGQEELWENLRQELSLEHDRMPRVKELFFAGDEIDQALVETIRLMRPKFKIALLSNAWRDLRSYLENEWEIADIFDEMVISGEEGVMKPDPEIYQFAIDRLGVPPDACVFLDDFEHNIEGARACGMHGIHFQDPETALAALSSLISDTDNSNS